MLYNEGGLEEEKVGELETFLEIDIYLIYGTSIVTGERTRGSKLRDISKQHLACLFLGMVQYKERDVSSSTQAAR